MTLFHFFGVVIGHVNFACNVDNHAEAAGAKSNNELKLNHGSWKAPPGSIVAGQKLGVFAADQVGDPAASIAPRQQFEEPAEPIKNHMASPVSAPDMVQLVDWM